MWRRPPARPPTRRRHRRRRRRRSLCDVTTVHHGVQPRSGDVQATVCIRHCFVNNTLAATQRRASTTTGTCRFLGVSQILCIPYVYSLFIRHAIT